MKIFIRRHEFTDRSTIGELFFNAEKKFCDTLELSCRRGDEKGLLAISPGTYPLRLDYSPKFKKEMWEVFNVPRSSGKGYRVGILFHPANTPDELDGCIAPGAYDKSKPDWISRSRSAMTRLDAHLRSEPGPHEITITGGLRL